MDLTPAIAVLGCSLIAGFGIRARSAVKKAKSELDVHLKGLKETIASEAWKEDDHKTTGLVPQAICSAIARKTGGSQACAAISRRVTDTLERRVDFPRSYATYAVYFGLAGTLVGLSIAVVSLQGIGTADAKEMRNLILGVVGGFGSSFACALFGVIFTIWTSNSVAQYSSQVEAFSEELEVFLAETVQPFASSKKTTVGVITKEVRAALQPVAEIIGTLPQVIRESMAPTHGAVEELRTQIQSGVATLDKQAKVGVKMLNAADKAAEALADWEKALLGATDALGEAAAGVDSAASKFSPHLKSLNRTLEAVKGVSDASSETITVLEQAAATAGDIAKQSDEAIDSLKQDAIRLLREANEQNQNRDQALLATIEGFQKLFQDGLKELGVVAEKGDTRSSLLKDDLTEFSQQNAKALADQALAFREIVTNFQTAVENLHLSLHSYSQLIKDLPLGNAATLLSHKVEGVVEDVRSAHEADQASRNAAALRLDQSEERISRMLDAFETVRLQMLEQIKSVAKDEETLRSRLDELDERLHGPVWKFFGGRG